MHFLVEAHLAFCPRCRQELQAYEAEAGLGLENLPPEEMDTHCLENLLHKIDEHGPPACIDVTIPARDAPDPRYPENLRVFTGPHGEKIVWREAAGAREWRIPAPDISVRLMQLAPGQRLGPDISGAAEILLLDGEVQIASTVFHGGDVLHAMTRSPGFTVRVETLCLCVEAAREDRPNFFERMLMWLKERG
jgi:anti-sigma factor ChrR (cupin superfamily)